MSHGFVCGARTGAATAATAGLVVANIWNPHATVRPRLTEIHVCNQSGASVGNAVLRRTTARGTVPAATVTPDIDNNLDRTLPPPSGLVIDLGPTFTTQPTVDASDLYRWTVTAAVGAGIVWTMPAGLVIPPGTGLAIVTSAAIAFPIADITCVWDE